MHWKNKHHSDRVWYATAKVAITIPSLGRVKCVRTSTRHRLIKGINNSLPIK